jgi:hypothetical protein
MDNSEEWIVLDCHDLHNVLLVKDGTGITISHNGEEMEFGAASSLCFAENCIENTEIEYPIYITI